APLKFIYSIESLTASLDYFELRDVGHRPTISALVKLELAKKSGNELNHASGSSAKETFLPSSPR
ncbi:MAG: hypothetical protein ABSD96_16955, partial [Candidatus Korobacteraceae bacterium]